VELKLACGHDGGRAQLRINLCVGRYWGVCIAGPVAVVTVVQMCAPSETVLSLLSPLRASVRLKCRQCHLSIQQQ
jgi:hypothetical protein